MAGEGENKDKAMAATLKAAGVTRHSMKCPVCHGVVTSHTRTQAERSVDPKGRRNKAFSSVDFRGALQGHMMVCSKG